MVDHNVIRERDYGWREGLAGCSLVMEVDADEDEVAESFAWLGQRFRLLDEYDERERLLRMHESTVLVSLSSIGGRSYESGSFWPQISAGFGGPLSQPECDLLARVFKQGLTNNGLRRFTMPLKNVGEILMHAGVPIASFGPFLAELMRRDEQAEGTGGRQFAAWASTLTRQAAGVYGLDAPSFRFLTEGGEIAEDFVDRCLLAVDAISSGARSSAFELGLSRRLIDEIDRLLDAGSVDKSAPARHYSRSNAAVPVLRWDRGGNGVTVALPELMVGSDPGMAWTVIAEGQRASYQVQPEWPGQPLPSVTHIIGRPAKVVTATISPSGSSWEIGLIDPKDPILVFDGATGDIVPARNSLPRGRVTIGVPTADGLPFSGLVEFRGPEQIIHEHPSPYGWEQWAFATVDVSQVSKFRRGEDRWRYTSTVSRPELIGHEMIAGLSTVGGEPVLSTVPHLVIPAEPGRTSQAPAVWKLALSDLASGDKLWFDEVNSGPQATEIKLSARSDLALVGEFQLSVQGPLGRGVTRNFAVAEGWSFDISPRFRYMSSSGDGLEPGEGTFVGGGKRIDVNFDSLTTSIATSIPRTDGRTLDVRAQIPYMNIILHGADERPRSSIRPLSIDVEDLETLAMRVSVPRDQAAALALIGGEETYLQSIQGGNPASRGFIDFNLAQAADTARAERSVLVKMVFGNRSMPVAHLRPRKLAEGIRLDDSNRLVVDPPIQWALCGDLSSLFALEVSVHSGHELW